MEAKALKEQVTEIGQLHNCHSQDYVTTPSARLKQSHERGGLSSGGYLY